MVELRIEDLHVSVEGKEILKGLNLKVRQGEIHALMGPNASGKSTLSYTIMGHPKYKVEKGDILLNGESIIRLSPDERARKGLFLAFQYPLEIPGVSLTNFLRIAYNNLVQTDKSKDISSEIVSVFKFKEILKEKLKLLKMDESFANRYLNEGFSGGEKKKCEILQMAILRPKIAILDETDSGLDVDALKTVAKVINTLMGPDMGILFITHYQRILRYVRPSYVHILLDGRIVKSGKEDLALELEEKGYDWIKKELLIG
jgi:Fe-S cluster assembly ATP-binding protein